MNKKNRLMKLFYAAAVILAGLLFFPMLLAHARETRTAMDAESDIMTDTMADPALLSREERKEETEKEPGDETVFYERLDGDAMMEITKLFQNKMAGDVYIEVRNTDGDIVLPTDLMENIRVSQKNFTMAFVDEGGEMEYAYRVGYKDIPSDKILTDINLKFDLWEEEAYPDTKRLSFRQDRKLPFPVEITLFENEALTDYHIYSGDLTALTLVSQEKSASDGYLSFTVETLEPLILSSTDIESALQDAIDQPREEALSESLSEGREGFSLTSPLMIVSFLILLIGVIMAAFLFFQKRR